MKYAENNRISHRQLYRQIILTFLAPFLLCIPGAEGVQGVSGVAGIIVAVILSLMYVFFLPRTSYYYTDPVKILGWVKGGFLGIFYLIYVIMTGVYILMLIEKIVPVWAVSGISVKWLSFWAVLICAYGMNRGMQRRGRMADVSGGIFLFMIIMMLILCIGQGKPEYLKEMWQESPAQSSVIPGSAYRVLCAFSGISLIPFALMETEKRGSTGKTVAAAILTIGGILSAVLFILPGVLGWKRILKEIYPILPLMAGADLPGNVLARFDVLWLAFLLYGIFFALGSCFHYGAKILDTIHLQSGKYWIAVIVYVLSFIQINGKTVADLYKMYLEKIFVPGLILIQICLLLRGQQKRRKKAVSAVGILGVLILGFCGCAGMEPEKRMYPLAMGIDLTGDDYVITYGMPDLPKATGQGKNEEDAVSVLSIQGKNFDEVSQYYERTQEKYLDIGHLQILVMGRSVEDTGKWREFLEYLKAEPLAGENIYVFQTENAEQLLKWSDNGTSLGEYVTGLMENQTEGKKKKGVTLRQVYHQWYQDRTLIKLPEIIQRDTEIEVWLE